MLFSAGSHWLNHTVSHFSSFFKSFGGGIVLDDCPVRHRRGDQRTLDALAIRESGSGGQRLLQAVAREGHALPTLEKLAAGLNREAAELGGELAALCASGEVLEPLPGRYLAGSVFDKLWDSCRGLLEQYHRQNPLHAGMKVAELRQKLLGNTEQAVSDALLAALAREGKIRAVADWYALADFSVHLTKRQTGIRDRILQAYRKAGLETPGLDEIYSMFEAKEQTDCKQVVESLVSGGGLVMLTPQICVHREVYGQVCRRTAEHFAGEEELTLAQFRDMGITQVGLTEESLITLMENSPLAVTAAMMDEVIQDSDWAESYPAAFVQDIQRYGYDRFDVLVQVSGRDAAGFVVDAVERRFHSRDVVLLDQGEERGLGMLIVSHDAALLELTAKAYRLYALCFLFMGFAIYASAFFTALNNGLVSALISFLRTLVFQCVGVLILPILLELDGVWLAVVAAEAAACAVSVLALVINRKVYRY